MVAPGAAVASYKSPRSTSSLAVAAAILGAVAGLYTSSLLSRDSSGLNSLRLVDAAFVSPGLPTASSTSQRLLAVRSAKGPSGGGPPPGKKGKATPFMAGAPDKKKQNAGKKVDFSEAPDYHQGVPVMYQGKKVAAINGTMKEYAVDIWSGAHPIWQGKKGKVMLDTGAVTRFQEKFSMMSDTYGEQGLDQLRLNEKLKKEQEERRKAGIRSL
mmetsp:Transcript_6102/g.13538  ORF Transcript_6102/g.13538 Transcript_6102/m.13538 type:complete len:213 (+) Transcript_6102:121-759(+)|eukprot:CAMPEP_0178405298 /NCGR_PEP_ID=MMETSP0689_2-20121128/18327_1 /TAXON_ID=160604 /ORGANISM="Amphidinium massartii, Strain CS-259" /LENGTH=212 /DNA_ID=CAMNT_0020026309 /DNA_START=103 /DNA_END=741 /DNA_ORIENTATION=-